MLSLRSTHFSHALFCLWKVGGPKVRSQGITVYFKSRLMTLLTVQLFQSLVSFSSITQLQLLELTNKLLFVPDLIVGNLNLPSFFGKIIPLFFFPRAILSNLKFLLGSSLINLEILKKGFMAMIDPNLVLAEEIEFKLAFVFKGYLSFIFYLLEMRSSAPSTPGSFGNF